MSYTRHQRKYIENINNLILKEPEVVKQSIFRKKKKDIPISAKIRFAIFSIIVILFISPVVSNSIWHDVLLRGFNNNNLDLKIDSSYFNDSEESFNNDILFDSRFLNDVNTQEPEMTLFSLNKELSGLKSRIQNISSLYPNITSGVFVWDFQTGNYISINGDKEFSTASIIKLPVLCQLFRRVDGGFVNLNEKIKMTSYYRTGGSGKLQFLGDNSEFDINTLAKVMIQQSDNTATNMLLSTIGGSNELNRNLRNWGFSKTHIKNWLPDLYGENVSTPFDLATILYNIDNPNFLSLKSRAKIVEIMSHVKNRNLIQKGLPEGTQFIHKTGDIGEMLGDAGIVMMPDGRKYIIVVMAKRRWNDYSAQNFIVDTSKTVYNAFASNSY
ncbi:MAG: serine hydrolase [Candidatus Gastranaerophilaceae bacterium]